MLKNEREEKKTDDDSHLFQYDMNTKVPEDKRKRGCGRERKLINVKIKGKSTPICIPSISIAMC